MFGDAPPKTPTDEVLDALVKMVGDGIWASELQFFQGSRRCDFWTISPNSSSGFKARAFEIKVSRADFRRDSFEKQRGARLFADQFYYVTPAGLLKKDEIPDWAGLIELHGGQLKEIVRAPLLDKCAPSWELVVSLIRNSGELHRDQSVLKERLRHAERQIKAVTAWAKSKDIQPWQMGIY